MQRGGNGMGDFFGFGDPFAGLRSSGDPFASFMGSAGPGSIASQFFGGRDPFDDPFFSQPFGGLMGPSIFQRGMFPQLSPFGQPSSTRFVEQQAPRVNSSKGPIIKELNSDGEEEEEREEEGNSHVEKKKDKSRKHSRPSKEPFVEDPDEEIEEKKIKHMQFSNDFSRANTVQPQARAYSFQSSTVTYGGPNGAYYTSSTKRTGGDGVTLEESKEADTTTGKASHMISRAIREKGHSVTRKLNRNGRVDTMQTLHNLNEDELGGFEEAWKGNARQHLPGWNQNINMLDQGNTRNNGTGGRNEVLNGRGWALPSTEQPQPSERMKSQRPNSYSKSYNRRAS